MSLYEDVPRENQDRINELVAGGATRCYTSIAKREDGVSFALVWVPTEAEHEKSKALARSFDQALTIKRWRLDRYRGGLIALGLIDRGGKKK